MLQRIYGVLLPFFISLVLAFILDPIVGFIQVKCKVKNRVLSVLLTLLLLTGVVFGTISLLTPVVNRQVQTAGHAITEYVKNYDADKYFSKETQEYFRHWMENMNIEEAMSYPEVRAAVDKFLPKVVDWITGGLNWIGNLMVVFMCLLYLVFLMIEFPKIRANWSNYVPKKIRPYAITIMKDIHQNMKAYFRGQSLVALIICVLLCIGFTLIDMPMGVAMGLIIGFLCMIPYMKWLGLPACILLCVVHCAQTGRSIWTMLLLLALVFAVVQLIEDFILTPKIMGKVMGMGPAAILLALSLWGAFFGVIGMIVALPLTTLAISYYKHYVLKE